MKREFTVSAGWERSSQSAESDRPWFQYSLGTLMLMMALASMHLTLFDVSILFGLMSLSAQLLAFWRTSVAIQLNDKVRGDTPLEVKIGLYLYSLLLIGLAFGSVCGLGWVSRNVGGVFNSILERSLGSGLAAWVTPVVSDVSMFIIPFVLIVYAGVFISWSWPSDEAAEPCAELERSGD